MEPLSLTTFILTFFSIISVWIFKRKFFPGIIYISSIALAFSHGVINIWALTFLILYLFTCYTYSKASSSKVTKAICWLVIAVLGFSLVKHLVPGFNRLIIFEKIFVSPYAYPISLGMKYDKVAAAIGLLLFSVATIRKYSDLKKVLKLTLPIAAFTIPMLAFSAVSLSLVRFEPKIPDFWPSWVIINLLTVCVTEEVFFRYFIQGSLTKFFDRYALGRLTALLIATTLFTAIHYPAPLPYLALTWIAGFVYGYIYHKTGRVEASILLHFLVNTFHFFFLTYPMLVQ